MLLLLIDAADLSKFAAVFDLEDNRRSNVFRALFAGDSDFLVACCFLGGEAEGCLLAVDCLTGDLLTTDFMGEDFLETVVAAFFTVLEF